MPACRHDSALVGLRLAALTLQPPLVGTHRSALATAAGVRRALRPGGLLRVSRVLQCGGSWWCQLAEGRSLVEVGGAGAVDAVAVAHR